MPKNFICITCGTEYPLAKEPPPRCPICEDERQFVGWHGQKWTTRAEMKAAGHRNDLCTLEPGILGVSTEPAFAIGQRALIVQTTNGNVMWDAISYLDDDTVQEVESMGGLRAIAISHPHFYASMIHWSHAFGHVPIYLPEADREWIMCPDDDIRFWEGAFNLVPGLTLIQCGGHFPGSAVLHWSEGADGSGVLMVGDTIAVAQDRRHVSFMWSYPNYVPLPATDVERILDALRPYAFERVYSAWWGKDILSGAKAVIEESAQRYIRMVRR